MNGVVDAPARAAAIDPTASFCVSAPAGSGKTELLIQRYLCLLSRVSRPEQVLAITFTRKAVAEMRQRVINALQSAADGDPCDTPHQRVTRELAQTALAADKRGNWSLQQNAARFNIKTIDSFCAGLTRQMPVLSQFGGQAGVVDDAAELYTEAVNELFNLLDEHHRVAPDIAALLLHFDNNWERLQALLVSMLARREQWRDYVGVHHTPEESEAYLVATVTALVDDEHGGLARLLAPYNTELLELLQYSATNLSLPVPTRLPGNLPGDWGGWRRIRQLLLTGTGQWRKSVTKKDGFPADSGEPKRRKAQWQALVTQLQLIPDLQTRLAATRTLPQIEAGSTSWNLVLHLSRLLPTLAAQLLLVFQKHGVVDHSQVAQSALLALGSDDAPTDLALRLDYQIEHILVDEFQDTAITQYELLHKLTRGWGDYNHQYPQAPRTLMIVGDGMQSIYGFRGANVGLFLKAQREGFNGLALQHLELRCNFRSDAGVVEWANQTFTQAFPQQNDVYRGKIRYSPASAVRPPALASPVVMHAFTGAQAREQEVAFICRCIADSVDAGVNSLAVLGRTRSHLQPIYQRLRQLKIPCHAPNLDSLAQSPVVADLLTLCSALANDADRLAWMAMLRAPWCGLQLADLLCIAHHGGQSAVWSTLQDARLHQALSIEGRSRVQNLLPVLHWARAKRDRLGLRVWIEHTWLELGGPQCAPDLDSLRDAENFLQLVERAEMEGVGLDLKWLSQRVGDSYMSAGDPASTVQLLTLHKAKGLEFDQVIIPQLDRTPRSNTRELLLWDEHSNPQGERSFLLAADDLGPADAPTLYNYLKAQRLQKSLLETTRLLYVGATRAIRELRLTACVAWDEKADAPSEPSAHSLLNPVWHTFSQCMTLHRPHTVLEQVKPSTRRLIRLRQTAAAPATVVEVTDSPQRGGARVPRRDNALERSIGIVVHQALEDLSKRQVLPADSGSGELRRWRMALQRQGLWGEVLDAALQDIQNAVALSLGANHVGRWILSSAHANAHSEWALTTVTAHGTIRDIVIDRSFIDRDTGRRWIIDYKSGRPAPGESLDNFVVRECANHIEQLRCYRDAVRLLGAQPLHCALYFTALGHFHTVAELDLPAAENGTKPCDR